MARAASFAQAEDAKSLFTLDTAGTPAGATAAAKQALRRGAGLILGPVFSEEVRPVIAAINGRVPVIAFSNDAGLVESGAFLLGITADQAVAPLIAYARGRGVRRVAIWTGVSAWDRQVDEAAARAAQREGVTLIRLIRVEAAASMGADAFLLSDGEDIAPAVRTLRSAGVQPLAAFAGLDADSAALADLEGLWLSAPDPAPFATFAQSFEARNGSPPGVITGLARDGAAIAATLQKGGGTDRSAILAAPLFSGICGDVRFHADGSAARRMAVLAVERGRYRVVERFNPT